jgi:hypothetical protein
MASDGMLLMTQIHIGSLLVIVFTISTGYEMEKLIDAALNKNL